MGTRTRGRVRLALGVCAAVLVAVVALGALGLYLAPRVLPNLSTTLAETDTAQSIVADGVEAELTVPAGWVFRRGSDDDALVVRSPDGQLTVTVIAKARTAAQAFAAESDAASAGTAADERLGSGLDLRHAGDREAGVFIAAVGQGATAASALIEAHAPVGRLDEYRAELAGLLESVRVRS